MKKLMREPLVHFLLLGAAIFVAYSLVSKPANNEPGKIVITQGQLESMLVGFTRLWQRPPTGEEFEGLIRDRVREEVYYREALALGLDKDDTIIRRRLRQKMEFIADDVAARTQPTDDDLGAYLKAHADLFRMPQLFTFSQVYLDPKRHGENLVRDTAQLLSQLKQLESTADISALGDSIMVEHKFDALPAGEIAKLFGEKFAMNFSELPLGQWQGPVESAYGVHLVFVSERSEERVPALSEIREAVQREWSNARRLEANENFYAALFKRYTVTVERPKSVEEQKKLTGVK